MRVKKRDYSHLPVEEQIIKLKFKIKFLRIFSIIWSVFVVITAIFIWLFTPEWKIAVGILISIPLSLFGGGIQIKEYKKEVKKLQEQKKNGQ